VSGANIQAGFITNNQEGLLLAATPAQPLTNVTVSHVSVAQASAAAGERGGQRLPAAPCSPGSPPCLCCSCEELSWGPFPPACHAGRRPSLPLLPPQNNQYTTVISSAADRALFQDVTVRINFELMGGCRAAAAASRRQGGAAAAQRSVQQSRLLPRHAEGGLDQPPPAPPRPPGAAGGSKAPRAASAGTLFRGGVPTLRNTRMIIQAMDPAQFLVQTNWVAVKTETSKPVTNFLFRSDCWNGGFERQGALVEGQFR
jgi:hypothetical protein